MSFIATLQLGLLDCHNSIRKLLEQTENAAYNTSISFTMKRQWKPKLYNVSSIALCISYYQDNATNV